jgi:hypothetical protein
MLWLSQVFVGAQKAIDVGEISVSLTDVAIVFYNPGNQQ